MLDHLKGWTGLALALVAVALLALRESFRPWFFSVRDGVALSKRVRALEEKMDKLPSEITVAVREGNVEMRDWMRADLSGLGTRVDRYEKLTLGAQDALADNRNRIEALEEHGGEPLREVKEALEHIRLQLREQSTDLKWMRRQTGDGKS